MGGWNNHFLSNNVRTFLFKYYNNILGLNSRVAKFNNTVDTSCTFCNLAKCFPAPKESFAHIFYDCPVTNRIITKFCNKYFTSGLPEKEIYFAVSLSENERHNRAVQLVLDLLRYNIWEFKLQKKLPVESIICEDISDIILQIKFNSAKYRMFMLNCPFFVGNEQDEHGE